MKVFCVSANLAFLLTLLFFSQRGSLWNDLQIKRIYCALNDDYFSQEAFNGNSARYNNPEANGIGYHHINFTSDVHTLFEETGLGVGYREEGSNIGDRPFNIGDLVGIQMNQNCQYKGHMTVGMGYVYDRSGNPKCLSHWSSQGGGMGLSCVPMNYINDIRVGSWRNSPVSSSVASAQ